MSWSGLRSGRQDPQGGTPLPSPSPFLSHSSALKPLAKLIQKHSQEARKEPRAAPLKSGAVHSEAAASLPAPRAAGPRQNPSQSLLPVSCMKQAKQTMSLWKQSVKLTCERPGAWPNKVPKPAAAPPCSMPPPQPFKLMQFVPWEQRRPARPPCLGWPGVTSEMPASACALLLGAQPLRQSQRSPSPLPEGPLPSTSGALSQQSFAYILT